MRSHRGAAEPPLATMRSEEPIMHALAYIEMNYTKPITLEFISEYAHMSRSNFFLVFKKIVGDTFINYINTLRVSHAHRLLLTTDLSISAIAAKSGFSSVDYLTRVFKKTHGTAPSKLRCKYRS